MRHRNRPCPLPGAGVLAARRLGRALNPGRVTLLPDPRARPALRVSATKGWRLPELLRQPPGSVPPGPGVKPRLSQGGGSQPSPQNASALPCRGWALSGSCLSQSASEANTRPASCSTAEHLYHACARPRGLSGVGVPFGRTKASQRPKATEGKGQKGEEKSASS